MTKREDNFLNTISDKNEEILALKDQLSELDKKYWQERNLCKDYFVSLMAAKQEIKALNIPIESEKKVKEHFQKLYENTIEWRIIRLWSRCMLFLKKNMKRK